MHEFRHDGPDERLMSEAEAKEVLRLFQARGADRQVSTADVAEAIQVPEDQVGALLAEVRSGNAHRAEIKPVKARKRRDITVAIVAAVLFLAIALAIVRSIHVSHRTTELNVNEGQTYVLTTGAISKQVDFAPNSSPMDLAGLIKAEAERYLSPDLTPTGKEGDPKVTIAELRKGNWDAPGIQHQTFDLTAGTTSAETSLPYYAGTDPIVQRMCGDERMQRIFRLVQEIAQKKWEAPGGRGQAP